MKAFKILKHNIFPRVIFLIAVVFAFSDYPSRAQRIYSDEQLFKMGYETYRRDDFTRAAIYLFAYVQREPARYSTDSKHRNQVLESLAYAEGDRYESAGTSGDYWSTGSKRKAKPKPLLDQPKTISTTGGTQRPVSSRDKQQVKADREIEYYVMSRYKPQKIPVDLESWLNGPMKGFGLVAVNRDDESGSFNSFFNKLGKRVTPWKYKVMILPANQMKKSLNSCSRQGLRLVAVTNLEGGVTGLRYICFFRKTNTPPPPTRR